MNEARSDFKTVTQEYLQGTFALQEWVSAHTDSNYVPYSGATKDVNLNSRTLIISGISSNNSYHGGIIMSSGILSMYGNINNEIHLFTNSGAFNGMGITPYGISTYSSGYQLGEFQFPSYTSTHRIVVDVDIQQLTLAQCSQMLASGSYSA